MSELITTNQEIAVCDDAGVLLSALKQCAVNILGNLERMASILKRLDELGIEVTLDHALIPYIRMIANGQLSASCFIACAADPAMLQKAIELPKDAQERIGRDEPFELLQQSGEKKRVRPSEMKPREVNQAFGNGFVRSEEGQSRWLKRSSNHSAAQKTRVKGQHKHGYQESTWLPEIAGEPADGAKRCPTCRAKLLPDAECLKCKLIQEPSERKFFFDDSECQQDENEIDELNGSTSEGWQERLAVIRAAKQSGDELGFHVDWLLRFLKRDLSEVEIARIAPLVEPLSKLFDFEEMLS